MDAIVPHETDPVFVEVTNEKVWLRIGGHSRGEGRIAILTAKNARILAYALLSAAESTLPGS